MIPGPFMEAVDILRDEREIDLALRQLGQREMTGIGLSGRDQPATPVIPLPDEARVSPEGFGRGEILGPEIAPQAAVATKRRDAALGTDARTREHGHGASLRQPRAGLLFAHGFKATRRRRQ